MNGDQFLASNDVIKLYDVKLYVHLRVLRVIKISNRVFYVLAHKGSLLGSSQSRSCIFGQPHEVVDPLHGCLFFRF